MNKAEEQLLREWGRARGKWELFNQAFGFKKFGSADKTWIEEFRLCLEYSKIEIVKEVKNDFTQAWSDYYGEILRLIDNNVITDWPSFVTYMTGETYEREGVPAMKCVQCGVALNELMVGRCSQPHHEIPIVLCEPCCQASPNCVGCKAIDCDGYVKEVSYE